MKTVSVVAQVVLLAVDVLVKVVVTIRKNRIFKRKKLNNVQSKESR